MLWCPKAAVVSSSWAVHSRAMTPATIPPVAVALGLTELVLGAGLALVAIFVLSRSVVVVNAHEHVVRTDGDDVAAVLEPGLHVVRPFGRGSERVDRRTQELELPVDGTTSDGVDATVVVAAEIEVDDPEAAATEPPQYRVPGGSDMPNHRVAIMERAGELAVEAVERRRWSELDDEALAAALHEDLAGALEAYGVGLVELSVASINRGDGDEQSPATPDA